GSSARCSGRVRYGIHTSTATPAASPTPAHPCRRSSQFAAANAVRPHAYRGSPTMEKSRRPSRSRAGFGLVGTSFVAVLAAACGGGGGSSSVPGASAGVNPPAQASIAAELPKAIKDNVPLQIATDATYEPTA